MRKPATALGILGLVAALVLSAPAADAGLDKGPPAAGNPRGHVPVPKQARAVDTSNPTRVVGNGTSRSCTSAAVRRAVRAGGKITFDCGPAHKLIKMRRTAVVRNDRRPNIVIDGGGKITLSGMGQRRILYMNTCDQRLGWTTSHCQDQATPRLVLQNLTFTRGNATGQHQEGGGGGAVFVRGGQFKVVNSRFFKGRCDHYGTDLGGAALRVLSQFHNRPVYVVHSTFGGAPGYGGRCANGGALSSIGVSWVVLNSLFSHNRAIGKGANGGSPGGGNGGAIYADGNRFTMSIRGTLMRRNLAREGGGAVFFVSNDRSGRLGFNRSVLRNNPSVEFETIPGIFYIGRGNIKVRHTVIE